MLFKCDFFYVRNSTTVTLEAYSFQILALDGGGIRGLILMQVLIAVEKFTGHPIRDCFDWIAGSSTGAILALFLVHGTWQCYLFSPSF